MASQVRQLNIMKLEKDRRTMGHYLVGIRDILRAIYDIDTMSKSGPEGPALLQEILSDPFLSDIIVVIPNVVEEIAEIAANLMVSESAAPPPPPPTTTTSSSSSTTTTTTTRTTQKKKRLLKKQK